MALYDGFFDAVFNEETGQYDRDYNSDDFTEYFGEIIGSGVCVHNNPDSMQVRFVDDAVAVAPGYLFIQGYWLKNDADYTVALAGSGIYAIVAHLNTGARMIEIMAQEKADSYPDSLVLAYVTISYGGAAVVDDTRYDESICGVIDSAGSLSSKVEYALNYINTEIDAKLAEAEAQIEAQAALLDAKIVEVGAQVDKLAPPPVGTIKFSASQNIEEGWLRCDGSFINERDYPELVAALGKLTPSGDKFQLVSDREIGSQISNGVIYGGRMWVYSYAIGKLYGVDLKGNSAVKEITLTSESPYFLDFATPTTEKPIALSIIPHRSGENAKLFLAQIIKSNIDSDIPNEYSFADKFIIFCAEFSGEETSLNIDFPFSSIVKQYYYYPSFDSKSFIPFVYSQMEAGKETYYCSASIMQNTYEGNYPSGAFVWQDGDTAAKLVNRSTIPNIPFLTRGGQSPFPLTIIGSEKSLSDFSLSTFGLSFPSSAKIFPNAGAYLWGKDIYMIFVGTGIVFSRTLEEGSFGYLDTTSVLGTITQFGYLDYSQDEGTLYIVGQDTTNTVKVAKMVLNTLFDYANDGAWLPMIASDGVPAYIKAVEDKTESITDPVELSITISQPAGYFGNYASVIFNGEVLIAGTYMRIVSKGGTFTVGFRANKTSPYNLHVKLNGATAVTGDSSNIVAGYEKTATFKVDDYVSGGITLQGTT